MNQSFSIPSAFQLMGQRIEVEYNDTLTYSDDLLGQASYRHGKIYIQPAMPGHPRRQTDVEQTFFHELMHWIFHVLGRAEMAKDEELIEQVSGLLHQAFATAEYPGELATLDTRPLHDFIKTDGHQ